MIFLVWADEAKMNTVEVVNLGERRGVESYVSCCELN